MICLNCNKGKAVKHGLYGFLPCKKCQGKNKQITLKSAIEITTPEVKESRKQYKKDIVQPFRGGVLSKEYLDTYGTKGINITKQDIKEAKYVWSGDNTGYQDYYKP